MQKHSSTSSQVENQVQRQAWLSVLSQQQNLLIGHESQLLSTSYDVLREPEVGMVMVKGKTAGEGQVFNLGEVTVTRCVVRIKSGQMGFAYAVGRNKKSALLMALADAHLQSDQHDYWQKELLNPLQEHLRERLATESARVQETKVDFFTLVRGED